WQHDLASDFHPAHLAWGVAFSPLVDGDRVIVCPGGADTALAAYDKNSGALIWKGIKEAVAYSSPVLCQAAGRKQIVFLGEKNLVGAAPEDGKELWRFSWKRGNQIRVATPVCVGDYVFISSGYGAGCALVKIEADGDALHARQVYAKPDFGDYFSNGIYDR